MTHFGAVSAGRTLERDGRNGSRSGAQLILLWFLSFGLSLGAGYPAVFRYDPALQGGTSDAADYFSMVRGQGSEAAVHRQGRVLLPAVGRHARAGNEGAGLGGEVDGGGACCVVNAALVAATACIVFLLALEAGLETSAALAALLLWLSSFAVVQFQLAGGVDSAESLAVAAVLLAGMRQRWGAWPCGGDSGCGQGDRGAAVPWPRSSCFVVLEQREKQGRFAVRPPGRSSRWRAAFSPCWLSGAASPRPRPGPPRSPVRLPSLVEAPAALGRALWNRGNLYVFAVLLPFGLPGVRRLPSRLVVPSVAAAGTALLLATLVDSGSNAARPLFSALGPLLVIGAVVSPIGRPTIAPRVSAIITRRRTSMKSSLKVLALSVFVVAASVSSAAEPRLLESQKALVGPEYVFPSSANVQGVGAYFKTRMVLTNPTGSEITVLATLSTPAGFSASVPIALASFQTRVYENFLADVFGYTGGGGVNLVEQGAATGGVRKPFLAVAEVYVDASDRPIQHAGHGAFP